MGAGNKPRGDRGGAQHRGNQEKNTPELISVASNGGGREWLHSPERRRFPTETDDTLLLSLLMFLKFLFKRYN